MSANKQNASFDMREYASADAEMLLQLFRDTIRRVNVRDYPADQIDAWASDEVELDQWADRFEGHLAYVVEAGGHVVGFADMSSDGYLDRLFVSADHQRRGIATMLVDQILVQAIAMNLCRVTTESSITAKPFFLARGFDVVCQQQVVCRGKRMINYQMERLLKT